jgi:ABC-type sugar transport system ATPase subunit
MSHALRSSPDGATGLPGVPSRGPAAAPSGAAKPLKLLAVSKSFPGVRALREVDLELRPGEVHALVGENGAGKSTLLKLLSGALQPDSGSIELNGTHVFLRDPRASADLGIATIYQELSLVPWLSVAHNLFLGRERVAGKLITSKRRLAGLATNELQKLGLTVDPAVPVATLGVAEQQLVEIARALSQNAVYILMDEPTASLSQREIDRLFEKVQALRTAGVGILYISHRLEEIARIADRLTIMRDGCVVHSGPAGELAMSEIIARMVGRPISDHYPKRKARPGAVSLEVPADVAGASVPVVVRAGEIVGLAGLVGSGRTEWARRVFGADDKVKPLVRVQGAIVRMESPHRSRELGLGMVPENRKDHGLIFDRTVRDNITLTVLEKLANVLGFIRKGKQAELSRGFVKSLNIKCPGDLTLVDTLSGGNQQKIVLAKWLACRGAIIILDEPTRGIDVGAKQEFYLQMNRLCEEGKAVVLISSDLPELLSMSDRIYVMRLGRIVRELDAAKTSQQEVLYHASLGEGHPHDETG